MFVENIGHVADPGRIVGVEQVCRWTILPDENGDVPVAARISLRQIKVLGYLTLQHGLVA